jgi:phosphate acetyltransferase
MQLVNGLTRRRMPILQVARPTYEAAIVVHHTEPRMHEHQQDKVLAIRAAMEEYFQIDKLLGHKYTPEIASMTPRRFLRQLREKARTDLRTIVLPEGNVDRMLQAAALIRVQKVAKIAILGTEDDVLGRARLLGVEFDDGVTVIDHLQDPEVEDYVQTIIELRKHKGLPENMARDLMRDPNYFGAMMVHKGRADGMVSGSTTTTQATLRPAFEFIRTAPGCETVSSVFFMCLPGRVLVYGDCAVIPNPTALELAEIALASAGTAAAFGIEPRVAMLSYSTGSSGKGVDVDKVVEATAIVKARNPALLIEGPIQYDAAVDSVVAQTKLPDSLVAGRATVLIFPDLNTGNNTYKAVQRSADVIAIGPILQGLRRPVNDLSRGATVIDIVNTIIVTAIQSQSMVRKR